MISSQFAVFSKINVHLFLWFDNDHTISGLFLSAIITPGERQYVKNYISEKEL